MRIVQKIVGILEWNYGYEKENNVLSPSSMSALSPKKRPRILRSGESAVGCGCRLACPLSLVLSIVARKRVSGYNIFCALRARYIIIP